MAMLHGAVVSDERSQITTASPESVWRVWADTTTWPKWNPEVRALEFHGFFDNGVKGTMVTRKRAYSVVLTDVVQEASFTFVVSQAPFTTSYYHCAIRPLPDGTTRISESIALRGLLSAVIGPRLRGRIARGFVPALKALAARAENVERGGGARRAGSLGDAAYVETRAEG
jgi:hypothetical protein